MREYDEYGFRTRAIHTGNDIDKDSGAMKRPITMGNSYALPYDPTDMNWSSAEGNLYTRNGGTNQRYLQERIASLEGGEDCVVLASGVAALSGLFFALLNQGDHVIFSSVTYIAVYRLLNELFNNKFGVETTLVDTSDLAKVEAAIRSNTKLIHIETPGNPTLTVSDIAGIAETAKKQMTPGYGGVLSFGLKADHDTHNRFVQHLKVITSAVSLGHDESLIVFLGEDDERQYLYPKEFHNGFFRFSVGLEDVEDIIGDLRQAMKAVGLL